MLFFDSIKDFIRNLNRQEMIRYTTIYISFCFACMIGILIYHVTNNQKLSTKITQLNKSRSTVQRIFTEFQSVQDQKNKVDDILKNNKNFKIQKFFQDLLTQQGLSSQVTFRFGQEKLPNGYIQESLMINCTAISTKQLCELIIAIEKQPLVYITFVDITHLMHAKKINVTMTIATLRAEE